MDSIRFASDVAEIARLLETWAAGRSPMFAVDPPKEVRVGELEADGWAEWRMIASPVQPSDIAQLEEEIGVQLPPSYHAFLCCKVLIDLDFGEYTLPPIFPTQPLSAIRQSFYFSGAGRFLQFGSARGCGDPVCFDLDSPTTDGDYPIVVFNHDIVPQLLWDDPMALQPYVSVVAPSFRAFLTGLLTHDAALFPAPISPEEERHCAAWARVEAILEAKGLPRSYRPESVWPVDPWAWAEELLRKE